MPQTQRLLLTRATVELQLQGQLNVVCMRTVHVVLEGVVENREDALGRDGVTRKHQREGQGLGGQG